MLFAGSPAARSRARLLAVRGTVRAASEAEMWAPPAGEAPPAPESAPLPWRSVVILVLVTMGEVLAFTAPLPTLPFLVQTFGVAEEGVGYAAGLLQSAYFLSTFAVGAFWGRMSDVYGRRRVLALGLTTTAACLVAFGMATTLLQALAARSLCGLLHATAGICYATMREITTEDNRARGFSALGVAYGAGHALGPLLAALLSRPADAFPQLLGGTVFDRHPFLLVYVGAAIVGPGVGLVALAFFDEPVPARGWRRLADEAAGESASAPAAATAAAPPRESRRVWGLHAAVPITIGVHLAVQLYFGGVAEVVPIFLASRSRGLGLDPAQLGMALAPTGIVLVIGPLAFPATAGRLGLPGCLELGQALAGCYIALVPVLPRLPAQLLWPALMLIAAVRGAAGTLIFIALQLMTNSLVTAADAGLVNGLVASVSGLGRGATPIAMGSIYAAFAHSELPFPLDVHAPFLLLLALCVATLALGAMLARALGPTGTTRPPANGEVSDEGAPDTSGGSR